MSQSDDLRLLAATDFFTGLDRGALLAVRDRAETRSIDKGAYLFIQDDPATTCYVLRSGRMKLLQVTPEGEQVVMRYTKPGELFGGIAALKGSRYPLSAEVVTDATLLAWDGPTLRDLMVRYPTIALNAVSHLADYVQVLQSRILELTTQRVERRLARALTRLAGQVGKRTEDGVLLTLPLSRQDLAELTGTTLYTVSRILTQWERDGLIESGRERVLIRTPHGLVRIAEDT